MTDTLELPPTWRELYDIAAAIGLTTSSRKDKWAAICSAKSATLTDEYVTNPSLIDSIFAEVKVHGLKQVAMKTLADIRAALKTRQQVSTAAQVDKLQRMLQHETTLWDTMGDEHPGADIVSADVLRLLRNPPGYKVTAGGVYKLTVAEGEVVHTPIAPAAIFPVSRSTDYVSGATERMLAWRSPDGWRRRSVPREHMLDSTKLIGLASFDAPVASGRAVDIAAFLDAFESANAGTMPSVDVSHRLGWTQRGDFVLPDAHWPAEEGSTMNFMMPDGLQSIAKGWTSQGSVDEWMKMAAAVTEKSLMWIPLYAALASPLLKLVDCPGWVTDISGITSGGKSTSAIFAASACGRPVIGEAPSIIVGWNNTQVYIEQVAGMNQHLPLFLDDTKGVKGRQHVRDVVYMFAQGIGRGRGAKQGGVRDTHTWQCNMISTGETSAVSFSNDGGTRARIVTVVGRPMGEESDANRQKADYVKFCARENYGHILPMVIDELSDYATGEGLATLKAYWRQRKEDYSALCTSGVAYRQAEYVATMSVIADILHGGGMFKGLGVPRPSGSPSPFEVLIRGMQRSTDDADVYREAMREFLSQVTKNRHKFKVPSMAPNAQAPHDGWYGSLVNVGEARGKVCVESKIAKQWIREHESDPNEVIDRWIERGWIAIGQKGRFRNENVGDGQTMFCLVITHDGWLQGAADESLPVEERSVGDLS